MVARITTSWPSSLKTPEQLLGLDEQGFKTVMQRTQPEGSRSGPGDIDRTLHSLQRFVRMAAAGNPSILMTMWAPVEYSTPLGEELQVLGEAFVGRHVVPRYFEANASTGGERTRFYKTRDPVWLLISRLNHGGCGRALANETCDRYR